MLGLILLATLARPPVDHTCRSQEERDTTTCLGSESNLLRTNDRRLPFGRIRTGFGACPDGYYPLTPYADGWSCVENVSPGQSNGGGNFIFIDPGSGSALINPSINLLSTSPE